MGGYYNYGERAAPVMDRARAKAVPGLDYLQFVAGRPERLRKADPLILA
jgi:hypothetical protein